MDEASETDFEVWDPFPDFEKECLVMRSYPSLSVRALARLLQEPATQLRSELREQKYPAETEGAFKQPYYQYAVAGISEYWKRGNDRAFLNGRLRTVPNYPTPGKKKNVERALEAFQDGSQSDRTCTVLPLRRRKMMLAGLEVRCSPDLDAEFGEGRRSVFFHMKKEAVNEETARTTLELAYLVLHSTDPRIGREEFEFIDLAVDRALTIPRLRPALLRRATEIAALAVTMWPQIEAT